jgi:Tfp pilus assembly protein PilF
VTLIENLEKMLAEGRDNALLRYSLGSACLKEGALDRAREHLKMAVTLDAQYSAAWKSYAQALERLGETDAARVAYQTGIRVAEQKGDLQAAKEMHVFLRRLRNL